MRYEVAGGESPPVVELDVSPLTHATHHEKRVVAQMQYDSAIEKVGYGEVKGDAKEVVELILDDVHRQPEGLSTENEVSPSLSSSPVSDIERFAEEPMPTVEKESMPAIESLQLTTTATILKGEPEELKATDSTASVSTQRVPRCSTVGEVRFMTEPLAREIIVWRQERGAFKFLRDLKRIVSAYTYYQHTSCCITSHILHFVPIYIILHLYMYT